MSSMLVFLVLVWEFLLRNVMFTIVWLLDVVAAFVVALASSSQNTRQVMFSQRSALNFVIPKNMTQEHIT